jgi:hypothetical protein
MAMTSSPNAIVDFDSIRPEWPVSANVRAFATTRQGGHSQGPYTSLNLADHVGDDPASVVHNRTSLLRSLQLPSAPRWLQQVHGSEVVHADAATGPVAADAAWSATPGVVCAVQTADCLPVLFCALDGSRVAAAHAGWRGMCAGVLAQTAGQFLSADILPEDIFVWLGPAIGPDIYEVDAVVRDAFLRCAPDAETSFVRTRPGHWTFNLYLAARTLLVAQGLSNISGGGLCTYTDERFFSYRREPDCGRQATLIWLEEPAS